MTCVICHQPVAHGSDRHRKGGCLMAPAKKRFAGEAPAAPTKKPPAGMLFVEFAGRAGDWQHDLAKKRRQAERSKARRGY